MTEVGENAFYYSSSSAGVKSITLPDSLQKIDSGAFCNLSIKQDVFEVPANVTFIGSQGLDFRGGNYSSLSVVRVNAPQIEIGGKKTFSYDAQVLDLSKTESIKKAEGNTETEYLLVQACKDTLAYAANDSYISYFGEIGTHIKAVAITNGGTFPANTIFESGKLATPVKDGYIFDGWYADSNFSGNAVTAPTAGQTYYAKWAPNSGFCGAEGNEENVTWKLTPNKEDASTYTLTISGTGDMANLVTLNEDLRVAQNNQPWANVAHQITKLELEEGITSIGDGAFYDMPLLKSAEIPASITKIGVRAFNWAETMDSLTFAKGSKLKEIGYAAFNNIAISEVMIPASVEKIDKQAFGNDSNLVTVLFEQGSALKEIEENVFFKCGKLTKLILPEGLTAIGNRTFNNENANLAAVVIPATVTSFGEEIYNTQGGCLYFENSEVYNRYTKPQIMKYFMAVTNGGTFPVDTTFTANELATPVKDGYIFDGWYTDSNFSGTAVTTSVAGQTYYAKWKEKADKAAPAAPTLKNRTHTSITLNTIEGAQYRCNGGAWQASPEFTGLTAGTAYTFEAYYPETDDCKASPASAKAEFTTRRSSSGGGSSSGSIYAVSVPSVKNGDVTVSPQKASKGDNVTITVKPDDGYQLDELTVTDKNGNALKLTDKGNGLYTFTMPAGKVEVNATFAKKVETSPFSDVSTNDGYYEAVKWAQEKGITGGIGGGLFGPNQPCTRAQIVSFLWRAAGSPEPKNMSSFSDVSADSYYAKAVAWAIENGITSGTGDGKFSPDVTCTRAQSVTFLYRAFGAPAVSGSTVFSDVPADTYYTAAVKWAAENGITGGIGGGLFGSDNDCTRAQIVTFLYRAYQK